MQGRRAPRQLVAKHPHQSDAQKLRVEVVKAVYGRDVQHPEWRWSVLPGLCPKVLTAKTARAISTSPHNWWVAHKTDGVRAIVHLTPKGEMTAFDRRFEPFVRAQVSISPGSPLGGLCVFDAEIAQSVEEPDGPQVLLLHDAFMVEGICVSEQPFSIRQRMGMKLCQRLGYRLSAKWRVAFKPFVRVAEASQVMMRAMMTEEAPFAVSVDDKPFRSFPSDGAVFVHEDVHAHDQRSPNVAKCKPVSSCTVDFVLGDRGSLLLHHLDDVIQISSLGSGPSEHGAREGTIVECRIQKGEWHIVRVRRDRKMPNSFAAAFQTMAFLQAFPDLVRIIESGCREASSESTSSVQANSSLSPKRQRVQ